MKKYLVALVLGVMIGAASPAFGSAAVHFPNTNAQGDDGYEIDTDRAAPFGNLNFVNRFHNAASEWSGISGSGLDFINGGQRFMSSSLTVGSVTGDETWVMDYWTNNSTWNWPSNSGCSGCVTGTTTISGSSGGVIDKALIRINDDDEINWSQGGVPGPTAYGLQSTMTHEIGHAAGGKGNPDFGAGSAECNGFYTMCGLAAIGTAYKETVSPHEIADMAAKY